ncbi:GNAT family N-acetyltransferase [Tenacibaculum amylolyticum]|uniref:GNAT family N-acetyltransferase n=1 Tax=Tenacibaculum amylolyticum TaxID=104269 RepID=UPI0038936CF3
MLEIIIRKATIEDLPTLLEFEQGVIEAERPLDEFLKEGDINYYNIKKLITAETTNLLVAVHNDELVGSGYLRIDEAQPYHKNPKHGYVGFMYVKPAFRGQRISNKILEALKEWAKSQGLKEIRLDVYSDNIPALKSYERFGFGKSLVNMRMNI